MSEDWVGCRVSLDCGGLGFFQGVICRINLGDQTVTIEKPFQNGLACKFPEITLNASDIQVAIKLLSCKVTKTSYQLSCNSFLTLRVLGSENIEKSRRN